MHPLRKPFGLLRSRGFHYETVVIFSREKVSHYNLQSAILFTFKKILDRVYVMWYHIKLH